MNAYILSFLKNNISSDDMIDESKDHYRVKKENMPANLFSMDEWQLLEAAGALFIPYAGRRSGGFGNYLNSKCNTVTDMYRYFYYENYLGTYWTSTLSNPQRGIAIYIYTFYYHEAGGEKFYDWGRNLARWTENGRYGQSVRLAKPVPQTPTAIEETTENTSVEIHKVLRNNQLFILRGEQIYTVTGQGIQ